MNWKSIAVVGLWFACSSCILGANPGVVQPETGGGGDVAGDVSSDAGDTAADTMMVAETGGDTGPVEDSALKDTGRDTTPADTSVEDTSDGTTDTAGGMYDCPSPGATGSCKPHGEPCSDGDECMSGHCGGGTCAQTIFVTSRTFNGNLGGLSGADAKCNKTSLAGDWRAVLSTSDSNAIERIAFDFPLYNRNGEKVADSKKDLWKIDGEPSLDHAIRYDARANQVQQPVWTGTKDDGEGGKTCEFLGSWNTMSPGLLGNRRGTSGQSGRKDIGWSDNNIDQTCDTQAAIYCIDGQ